MQEVAVWCIVVKKESLFHIRLMHGVWAHVASDATVTFSLSFIDVIK